jgi:hypothetical protein
MGNDFNQVIKLPKGLIKLTTGQKFNQMIKLRSSIETLNLGKNFNQLIILPEKLKYMSMPQYCEQQFHITEELKEIYIYIKKPIILPISKEEFKERLLEICGTISNKTNIFNINFDLALSREIRNKAIRNEW